MGGARRTSITLRALAAWTISSGRNFAETLCARACLFRNGWNIFDFVIVGISLVPAAQGLSVLRAMRILRLLRVLSVTPSLRRVVEGLMNALPGMGLVFLMMGLIFYIGAVMAARLFGAAFPE